MQSPLSRLASLLVVLSFFQAAAAQNSRYRQASPRIADSRAGVNRNAANVGPRGPIGAKEAEYIDKLLKYWEYSSSKIKRYRCTFQRDQFDPVFGPAQGPKTIARGTLKYAAPDKGLYHVNEIYDYKPPAKPGEKGQFAKRPGDPGEHWICDGKSVYEFDHKNKRIIERPLPPEMQGKAIAQGPLPFMFGAKAEELKRRYWFYVTTPKTTRGEYWLMAYPKTRQDAENFKMVEIILDEKDFLPKAIQVFDRNFKPGANASRSVFSFDKREVNPFVDNLNKLNLFHRDFYKPSTPRGWQRVVEKIQDTAPPEQRPPTNRQPAGGRPANQTGRNGSFPFQR